MSKPVYLLVLVKGATEAWHQLPQDQQAEMWQKAFASLDQAGGKAMISCDARWSSQQWWAFSVEEYPSVEVLQEHMKRLEKMNWWRYLEITTVLGTAYEASA
jgi:hypothetical protein